MGSVFAIDADGPEGEHSLSTLQQQHGPLPPTVAVRTGSGGYHLFYRAPPERTVRNSAGKLGPKLDVRSTGGYVVAPPSIHPNGRPYAFLPGCAPWEMPPAGAPAWLIDLLDPPAVPRPLNFAPCPARSAHRFDRSEKSGGPEAYALAALRNAVARVEDAGNGHRNHTLNAEAFSLARLVVDGSLSAPRFLDELAGAALRAGLGSKEVSATITSALRARASRGGAIGHA
jgi:hypothetical protein